uniref:NR LBD domain-containing protein n=1 Tax=Romanomermis culicivorax TaxID=13658 RepID=A0A915IGC1_ROMCU
MVYPFKIKRHFLESEDCSRIPGFLGSRGHDLRMDNRIILRRFQNRKNFSRLWKSQQISPNLYKLLLSRADAQGLSDRHSVKATRQNFLAVLQDYTLASTRAMLASQGRRCVDDVRFGNILLLSPPLQAMSQQFVEDLQLASLFGMATFDKLLEELLLSSSDYCKHVAL